ncbi:unnamed protein product [Staurois parvus]|uniref:Cytosolic fatty-acid binding proteins domain-containing protein n=1 Tax=Staurois parvus TaxID=386267 RepID=A0ABN9C796_9NEOB|nr:unnamed protein product [Staurois parvus]
MCEKLQGSWKLVTSEGFDDFMKALGVDMATRMIASRLKPGVIISNNGDNWSIKTMSNFSTTELCFKLNEEVDETTADKRKCKTIFTLEDGKLIQSQKWDCKESIITREVQNDQMITNCTYGNVKCRRVYEKN